MSMNRSLVLTPIIAESGNDDLGTPKPTSAPNSRANVGHQHLSDRPTCLTGWTRVSPWEAQHDSEDTKFVELGMDAVSQWSGLEAYE